MMITSASHRRWVGDIEISDLDTAGLPAASIVRSAKVATIEALHADRIRINQGAQPCQASTDGTSGFMSCPVRDATTYRIRVSLSLKLKTDFPANAVASRSR
jgi:hypothetical protein